MSPTSTRFSARRIAAFADAPILGVRSGTEHRYTGVWVVVVEDRVFVRSWNDKPTGWYRAFRRRAARLRHDRRHGDRRARGAGAERDGSVAR